MSFVWSGGRSRRLQLGLLGGLMVVVGLLWTGAGEARASGTVSVTVQGKGDVTGDGIDCNESGGPDCSQFYANVQECDPEVGCFFVPPDVDLTAGPDRNGYVFDSWTGCDTVDARVCWMTVTASRSVSASFRDAQAPSVSGVTPSGVRRGTIALAASASDNSGAVQRVEFRVRGTLVGTDTVAPYGASFNTASVADGVATVRATAFDAAGNSGFAESSITIDNTAPLLSITGGPDGGTYGPGSTQAWTFSASDATSGLASVQCSVTAAGAAPSFGACTGGTSSHSVTNLPEGDYALTVRATDNGGLQTSASRSFSIDATAPSTAITSGPKKRTTRKRARFAFISDSPGSSFACKLDGAAYKSCSSPAVFRVGTGRHVLRVRAKDAVGNPDPTPAAYTWKVRRKRR